MTLSRTHWPSLSSSAFLAGLFCLFAMLVSSAMAESAIVDGVRSGVTKERTRLVFDMSSSRYQFHVSRSDPMGMEVRLPRVGFGTDVPVAVQNTGRIYLGEFLDDGEGGLRFVLQYSIASRGKVFALESPPRLVIDIMPPESGDPAGAASSAETGSGLDPEGAPELDPEPVVAKPEPKRGGPRIVVIDPGHGGNDPGAIGPGLREKDVCLDVARRLHKLLTTDSGIHPVLTRNRDVKIPLTRRIELADEAGADLFISIHVNAAPTQYADGVEVYFLSLGGASDESAHELALLENEAGANEAAMESDLEEIPFSLSLRQSDTLLRSSRIAEVVLDLFVERKLARGRGVRQANFAVLRSYQVPSILVELGFASSEKDRKALKSAEHRQDLAAAMAAGIARYFEEYAPLRKDSERP